MITWLPRHLTSAKPSAARTSQTSRPDRRRSLPNSYVEGCDVDLRMETLGDLLIGSRLEEEEEDERFLEVGAGRFDGAPLAADIELGTKCNVTVTLALDHSRHVLNSLHAPGVHQRGRAYRDALSETTTPQRPST
jgi:hypothetical protein